MAEYKGRHRGAPNPVDYIATTDVGKHRAPEENIVVQMAPRRRRRNQARTGR